MSHADGKTGDGFGTLVIVGLGLLGGSLALAARERGLVSRIIGVGRRDLSDAVAEGVVDEGTRNLAEAAGRADILVLCSPVETIRAQLPEVMGKVAPGTLVTDVGSAKQHIVREAESIGSAGQFVGSHPMVGSHLTGWRNGRVDLFERGLVYITATERSDLDGVARIGKFWQLLGARTVYIDPARHDYLCALLSHVPHLVAVSLVEHLRQSREDINLIRFLSGNGLRDTTRIAAGSPQVWREICEQNGEAIAPLLEAYSRIASEVASAVRGGDFARIESILEQAATLRGKI